MRHRTCTSTYELSTCGCERYEHQHDGELLELTVFVCNDCVKIAEAFLTAASQQYILPITSRPEARNGNEQGNPEADAVG